MKKITDTTLGKDDAHFGFGKKADNTYRFELIYKKADAEDGNKEKLILKINETVYPKTAVTLNYKEKLVKVPSTSGTYKLYTNEQATLFPVDANNKKGDAVDFPKPQVEYVAKTTNRKTTNSTVTFKDSDKTHARVEVETGKAIDTDALTDQSMPKDPTKVGYTFKEWNTKPDGTGKAFTGTSVVYGDMTVYAIYTKNPAPTPEPQPQTPAPAPQTEKPIGKNPKTGEFISFAGMLVAIGFPIAGLSLLRKKKRMDENNK